MDHDLFVDRPELPEIIAWIHRDPLRDPILTLVAPPGVGKTWLLKAVMFHVKKKSPQVIDINLPDYTRAEKLDIKSLIEVLRRAYEEASKTCIVPAFNPHAHISQLVYTLIEAKEKAGLALLVVVDGYDETPLEVRREFDEYVLLPFISRKCVRILSAYRTGCRFENWKLRQKQAIKWLGLPDSNEFGVKQFSLIYRKETEQDPDAAWIDRCKIWMRALRYYRWEHPFINSSLFRSARKGNASFRLLTIEDLCKAIGDAVERPDLYPATDRPEKGSGHPPLTDEEFKKILKIAIALGNSWLMSEYEELFKVEVGHRDVESLLNQGVIEYITDSQRYQVAPGLYELLKDYHEMQGS